MVSKFRAVKIVVDGIKFDSKREAHYYLIFKSLEREGRITNLKLQTSLIFDYNGCKMFTYKPDFEYDDKYGHHIVDVKGVETPVFRLKKKLIEAKYGIKIEILK